VAAARFKARHLRRAARVHAESWSAAPSRSPGARCACSANVHEQGRPARARLPKAFKSTSRSMVEMSRENQKSTQHEHDGRNGAFIANHRTPPPTIAMVPQDCGRSGHVLGPRKGAAPWVRLRSIGR